MTPERIAEIYADETGLDLNSEPAALQDFARAIWNEALEETKVALDCTNFHYDDSEFAPPLEYQIHTVIDSLKLPEE